METIHKDYCSRCKTKEGNMSPTVKNINNKKEITTQYYICYPCNRDRQKTKYAKNPAKARQYIYKSIAKHWDKQQARIKLNTAVKAGKLLKPTKCSICSKEVDRIEGHHTDYSKPLEVIWTCTPCHVIADKSHKSML